MVTSSYSVLQDIKSSIKDYEIATGIKCYLLNNIGNRVGERSCYQCHKVCQFIEKFDSHNECVHDYLFSCKPTLDTEEPRFYRCPYGLVNIAIPVQPDPETTYFVSSGPILMDSPGNNVLTSFAKKNTDLYGYQDDLSHLVQEVPVLNQEKLQAVSNTLLKAVLPIVGSNLERFRKDSTLAKAILSSLRPLSREAGTLEFTKEVHLLQKELEVLIANSQEATGESRTKALDLLLNTRISEIFQCRIFETIKARAAAYILALWQAANNTDLDKEAIFGSGYELVLNFIQENRSRLELNNLVSAISERFKRLVIHGGQNRNNDIILSSMEFIRNNYSDISLSDVAVHVSLNPSYFSNLFKRETGQSYMEYLNKIRIEVSKQLLWQDMSLTEIAYRVGFTDQSHYINVFKKYENTSPSRWRKKQEEQNKNT